MDDFGGLWHLDVVDTKLSKLSSENEKRLALKIQLTFWQKVIGVKCAKTYFTMSSSGVMKPISKLLENLKHVITWNSDTPDTDVDFSKPYIISMTIIYMTKKNTKFIKITNISLLFRSFVNVSKVIYINMSIVL